MYKPEKAAAMASFFLEKAPGRRLNDIVLMKLLYIAERESLRRFTATITGSRFSSMKHGPVLSDALNNLRGQIGATVFQKHIEYLEYKSGKASENTFRLKKALDPAKYLSPAELKLIERVWREYGKKNKWALQDLTHEFPEWDKSVAGKNTSKPIKLEAIFGRGLGENAKIARAKAEDVEYYEALDA